MKTWRSPDLKKHIDGFNGQLKAGTDAPYLDGRFKGKDVTGDGFKLEVVFGNKILTGGFPIQVDAVVDDETDAEVKPLPVILTVGINYGQVATGSTRKTQMRNGLNKLNEIFPGSTGRDDLIPDKYHLVAWNRFPFLTPQPWAAYNFNGLEEALVIWRWGYSNWPHQTMKLITGIAPQVVVFHGINNAVPYHGMTLVDSIRPQAIDDYPRVIFCGNLARVNSVFTAKTTIEIRPPTIKRLHVHQVNDE